METEQTACPRVGLNAAQLETIRSRVSPHAVCDGWTYTNAPTDSSGAVSMGIVGGTTEEPEDEGVPTVLIGAIAVGVIIVGAIVICRNKSPTPDTNKSPTPDTNAPRPASDDERRRVLEARLAHVRNQMPDGPAPAPPPPPPAPDRYTPARLFTPAMAAPAPAMVVHAMAVPVAPVAPIVQVTAQAVPVVAAAPSSTYVYPTQQPPPKNR